LSSNIVLIFLQRKTDLWKFPPAKVDLVLSGIHNLNAKLHGEAEDGTELISAIMSHATVHIILVVICKNTNDKVKFALPDGFNHFG